MNKRSNPAFVPIIKQSQGAPRGRLGISQGIAFGIALNLWLIFPAALNAQTPSGADILARVDKNAAFKTVRYEAELEVIKGKRNILKTMKAQARADKRALIEFTNPEDMGISYLKVGSELWAYFPEENDTVKISGHQLKEGLMGSDISYEDAMDNQTLLESYQVVVRGKEEIEGRQAWVLDMSSKVKGLPYDIRTMWIDAERWISLKEELKSKDGTLLKTSNTIDVAFTQGRWYVSGFEMRDQRKKNSITFFSILNIKFDESIDPGIFSVERLKK